MPRIRYDTVLHTEALYSKLLSLLCRNDTGNVWRYNNHFPALDEMLSDPFLVPSLVFKPENVKVYTQPRADPRNVTFV